MKRCIDYIENTCKFNGCLKWSKLKTMFFLVLAAFFVIPCFSFAEDSNIKNPLIIYYSRTGKTKLVCDILEKHLDAHLLEIKDPADRSGQLGYMKSAYDAFTHRHTPIEPEKPDLSSYSFIIIASPILKYLINRG